MSNRPNPSDETQVPPTSSADEQSSIKPPVRPTLVGSGMFLPALIVLAIALVVILYLFFFR